MGTTQYTVSNPMATLHSPRTVLSRAAISFTNYGTLCGDDFILGVRYSLVRRFHSTSPVLSLSLRFHSAVSVLSLRAISFIVYGTLCISDFIHRPRYSPAERFHSGSSVLSRWTISLSSHGTLCSFDFIRTLKSSVLQQPNDSRRSPTPNPWATVPCCSLLVR